MRVRLDRSQVEALSERFAKVQLPEPVWFEGGALATSILVARVHGRVRAYANVCRHYPFPLDLGGSGTMSPDGRRLLCHTHGALYRVDDGVCTEGPCEGLALFGVEVEDEEDGVALVVG